MKKNGKDFSFAVSAAGRVNIIGEHIDYCGGRVLPAALSLKNTVWIRANGTNRINLSWTDIPDEISLDIDRIESYKGVKYADYFAACVWALRETGKKVVGCDVMSDCRVPFGSGLSSSAAIEVSFIAALLTVAGEPVDRVEVALTALKAEREFVGMNCGVMDQYASACGKRGRAMLLDCATLSCEYIPVDLGEYALVIANSNKPHSLVVSKYNERREESEKALESIRKRLPIEHLAALTPEDFEKVKDLLSPVLQKRTCHIVSECARVENAVRAMKAGDALSLGALLRASHASLRDLYEVTGRELDALADAANAFSGCAGARMTGGGFGGSAVALVKKGEIAAFETFVAERYRAAVGYDPSFYSAEIGEGIEIERL